MLRIASSLPRLGIDLGLDRSRIAWQRTQTAASNLDSLIRIPHYQYYDEIILFP